MLFAALLCMTLLVATAGALPATVTVDFTIVMPNGSYPTLGEYWEGTLTYLQSRDPRVQAGGFGKGHPIVAVTGTRTVWTSVGGPVHVLHSTANIIGLAAASNCYVINNNSIPLKPGVNRVSCAADQSQGLDGPLVVGLATFYETNFIDLDNYTASDGFQLYPLTDIAYDNLFYPPADVVDSMDFFGWLFLLDRQQPGTVPVPRRQGVQKLHNAVNVYSWNGNREAGGDLTTQAGNFDLPDGGYGQTPFGFNGVITIRAQQ